MCGACSQKIHGKVFMKGHGLWCSFVVSALTPTVTKERCLRMCRGEVVPEGCRSALVHRAENGRSRCLSWASMELCGEYGIGNDPVSEMTRSACHCQYPLNMRHSLCDLRPSRIAAHKTA
jgi:hypothetical protein